MINRKIGVIGCGNMGQAIIKGLLRNKVIAKDKIYACDVDKKKLLQFQKGTGINTVCPSKEMVKKVDIVILVVKPQVIDKMLSKIAKVVNKNKLVISVAAGISTKHIEYYLGMVPVVRVMPNMPALVCSGMSAVCKGKFAHKSHIKVALEIFNSIGKTVVVPETLMNAVTAVSGSGPAYIFEVMEDMIKGAMKTGLPKDISQELVKQTVLGAAKLVVESEEEPATLKGRVASPGGTTEAALKYLKKHKFAKVLIGAVQKAKKRAKELGK